MNFSRFSDCPYLELIGDGFCNDETNNENCNYDDGDCCGPEVDKKYCADCICHEDMEKVATFQTRSIDGLHANEEGSYHGLKDVSTSDFLTSRFNHGPFNPRFFNHGVEKFMVEKFGVEGCG